MPFAVAPLLAQIPTTTTTDAVKQACGNDRDPWLCRWAADWTDSIDVGNVTTVTLDISKDNVQFGLRAVDKAGNRSPVAFPAVAN